MHQNRDAHTAAEAINHILGRGSAQAIPTETPVVRLRADADPVAAIAAVRATFTGQQLQIRPVMLWHDADEILIGPHGTLSPTALLPGIRSLDVRVHLGTSTPARVVISWLDGPTRDEVADRLARLTPTGMDVELLRDEFDSLLEDVIDAAFTARGDHTQLSAHPVLARVSAVRDGRDVYFCLLDLAAEVTSVVKRRHSSRYRQIIAALSKLKDQNAVDAVLDDLDTRVLGGQFFTVRTIDDDTMLAAIFTMLALAARAVGPSVRQRARELLAV